VITPRGRTLQLFRTDRELNQQLRVWFAYLERCAVVAIRFEVTELAE
jgi:hypothetical protein